VTIRFYILFIIAFFIFSIYRIVTLPVHLDLPRLSSHQNGYYDYEGVIHWHTRYSGDALGTYEKAAELGNRYHMDFLISTEHNNLRALNDHKEGWHGCMLTLVGVESSRKEGYLLGLDFNRYTTHEVPTDMFLSQVSRQGGFVVIAHPKSPRWHWRGKIDERMAGQEIVDLTDQFATASPLAVLRGLIYYRLNTPAAYLQLYHRPADALKMWDEITSQRQFIGIYAPDLHQSLRILGTNIMAFPKAEDILPIAHNHVILSTPFSGDFTKDKPMLYDAIKKGHLYVAIDMLQDATGFFYSARQGDKSAWMGDQLPAGFKTDFSVTLPENVVLKNTVINVFHNGEKIAHSSSAAYSFQATLPGSYRIEVKCDIPTFWGFRKSVVWIYSNPIYLR